jgi:hypothetical protein
VRVQLAYSWTDPDGRDHAADDVVEVDDLAGRTMIREGNARVPDTGQFTMDQLRSQARDRGLDLRGLRSRAQLEDALRIDPGSTTTVITPGSED